MNVAGDVHRSNRPPSMLHSNPTVAVSPVCAANPKVAEGDGPLTGLCVMSGATAGTGLPPGSEAPKPSTNVVDAPGASDLSHCTPKPLSRELGSNVSS